MSVGVHVYKPVHVCKLEDNLDCPSQEQHPPPLRWGLSVRLASPQDPPESTSWHRDWKGMAMPGVSHVRSGDCTPDCSQTLSELSTPDSAFAQHSIRGLRCPDKGVVPGKGTLKA